MPFFLKSIISRLLHPVPFLVCLLALGCVLRCFGRTRRTGRLVHVASLVLFLAFGFGLFNGSLESLERTYPPFPGGDPAFCADLRGATVAVLGNGFEAVDLPPRLRVNDCFRQRLTEGAFACHSIPDSRLLVFVSGAGPMAAKQAAVLEWASTYGIATNRVDFHTAARDTVEEARAAMRFAGTNRVVVATSASHMPRAMSIFRSCGADPVAAPCDYLFFGPSTHWRWYDWHFGVRNFDRAERLMHESLGLLYERIRR